MAYRMNRYVGISLSLSVSVWMTLQLNFREESLIWWKLLICNVTQQLSTRFISKWQHILKDNFTVFVPDLCMTLFSMGIEQHYSHSNCIFDKGGFSVSSGLISPPLCLVHTGFSLLPHGSNDPLIILYSDALIKLMCWFYVFNLPWSPTIPSVPSGSAFTLKWGSAAALITVPR